jgi:Domain of Unknown Function (DUF928)
MNSVRCHVLIVGIVGNIILSSNLFSRPLKAQPVPEPSPIIEDDPDGGYVSSEGLGPNICGGKSLKAFVPGSTSVRQNDTNIRFYIPCRQSEILSLVFSLRLLPEGQHPSINENINTSSVSNNYYMHRFQLPESNKRYRWYLLITAKSLVTGEIESDKVSGYIISEP